jgi:hypothetical protein
MIANGFRRIALAQGLLPERAARDCGADPSRPIAEPADADAVPTDARPDGDKPAISAERERPA